MDKIKNLLRSRSARTSAIYYLGSFIVSFGNYIFHLVLIRLLAPAAYGEFLTYISFLYLITIPASTIGVVVTKYVSAFVGKKDIHSINLFFYFTLNRIILPVIILSSAVILLSRPLAVLLKAEPLAFVVLGVSIFTSLLGSIFRSYATSFQQFVFVTLVGIGEITLRVLIAVFLVTTGLHSTGAVIAMLLSNIIGLLVIFFRIKPHVYPKFAGVLHEHISLRGGLIYSLVYAAGTLSLISLDVLLVRYFFSTTDSGYYSGLSLLGRIIYFGISPLAALLLPIASARYASHSPVKAVFYKLGLATVLLGLVGVTIFSLFPQQIIAIFSGTQYLSIAPLLPFFSFSMFIFALNVYLLTFFIAIKLDRSNLLLLLAMLLQPLVIYFFHHSLIQVVIANLSLQVALLISLLFCYRIATRDIA